MVKFGHAVHSTAFVGFLFSPSLPLYQENLPRIFEIPVRRDHIFEDSHRAIMGVKNRDHLKARMWVKFGGETGLDYGGLAR